MTHAETIAEAVRDFSTLMAEEVKNAKTPEEQEMWTEMISIMRRIARCLAGSTFEEAKTLVLAFDEPERSAILDLVAKRGLFF